MNIYNEDDLLDAPFRKGIIDEIEGPENRSRKCESFKRYEIYRDKIKKYILSNLHKELDPQTVTEMESRIATVNMYKKMVQKKARVYKDKPKRISLIDGEQDYVDSLVDLLNLNTVMKKVNRYVEAFRNCAVYVKPYKDHSRDGKWSYLLDVLAPHQFDVIEDQDNPEMARVVVLSNYKSTGTGNDTSVDGQRRGTKEDDKKETNENDKTEYIFWSKSYHFTCDRKGQIISNSNEDKEETNKNPISNLPFEFFNKDQDGSFWAVGGEDIIDGSILINTLLTDLYFIAKVQGSGIFYMFGPNVPETFKVGPNRAITMKTEEGGASAEIGFASSNPPLDAHMQMIEQYVAFLLSTNDLGVQSIQGKLDGGSASSGIQEIIQNAEPMTAIEDEQEQYADKEPTILQRANSWQNALSDSKTGLTDTYNSIGSADDVLYAMKFVAPKHFNSESERLDAVSKKIDQGIFNKIDAYIEEHDLEMSREDAMKKLLEKSKENVELIKAAAESLIMDKDNEDNGDSDNKENKAGPEQD